MDRMEILRKVAAGEITADEAARLLQENASDTQAQADAQPEAQPEAQSEAQAEAPAQEKAKRSESGVPPRTDLRWLHVRVHDLETDRDQVKVNVPIGLLWPGFWFARCGWGWHGSWARRWWWWDEVEEALEHGTTGTLVDVEDDEHRKHVVVYVD